MPKMKTKSSAKKRFKLTGTGKIKENMLLKVTFLQRKGQNKSAILQKQVWFTNQTHQTSNNNCVYNSQLEFIN